MNSDVLKLNEVLENNDGVVAHTALRRTFSANQIHSFIRSGWLLNVHRAVYRGGGVLLTTHRRIRAAVLAAGDGAFASYRSASMLWGFGVDFGKDPEVTVPRGRTVIIAGTRIHTSNIADVFITSVGGIPVTNPERTLLEISTLRGDDTVRRITEDLVIRNIVDLGKLKSTYRLMRAMGRRRFSCWTRLMPEFFPEMGKMSTDDELRAFKAWRDAGMELPEPQFRMLVDGKSRYLDFAYPDLKIAIECDAYLTHDRLRAARDKQSDRWMTNRGWKVLRFHNGTPEAIFVSDVQAALLRRSA